MDADVLARGLEESPAEEECDGVIIHRVRVPERPRELGEFVTWVEHMNADLLAAGVELGDRFDFDVVHGRFRARDPQSLGQIAARLLTDASLRDRLVAEASDARAHVRLGLRRPPDRRPLRRSRRRATARSLSS